MASPADDSVVVDREYFATLVRRANAPPPGPPGLTIVIPRAEYDSLCLVAKQYANLRDNLLRGGVGQQTVDILSADNATNQSNNQNNQQEPKLAVDKDPLPAPSASIRPPPGFPSHNGNAQGSAPGNAQKPVMSATNNASYGYNQDNGSIHGHDHGQLHPPVDQQSDLITWGESGCPLDDDISHENEGYDSIQDGTAPTPVSASGYTQANGRAGPGPARPAFERRTIQLANLAPGTTHADVVAAVRGGLVLEIYLRSQDRCAMVSFYRGADAMAFIENARKHYIFVKNKRVDVRWAERQFTMNGMVASKVQQGATRNLVIYRRNPQISERMIRDDLDHIHNLVVISVELPGSTCIIRTNSIHNALFARSCLMSRAVYKGSRIEWTEDECAKPFDKAVPTVRPKREPPQAKKPPVFSARNRFQLLNLDGGNENNSDDDENHDDDDGDNDDGDDDDDDDGDDDDDDDDDDDAAENDTQDSASDINGGVFFSTTSISSMTTMNLVA